MKFISEKVHLFMIHHIGGFIQMYLRSNKYGDRLGQLCEAFCIRVSSCIIRFKNSNILRVFRGFQLVY